MIQAHHDRTTRGRDAFVSLFCAEVELFVRRKADISQTGLRWDGLSAKGQKCLFKNLELIYFPSTLFFEGEGSIPHPLSVPA